MSVTESAMLRISPGIARFAEPLLEAMRARDITTFLRASHFLAQVAHESAGFTAIVENLNYSESGLLKTFPRYFTKEEAKSYARQPERIANRVYANRMGNGNESSGDGWKYRGRGLIQLTGKSNYQSYGRSIVDEPGLLETPTGSAEVSAWFWYQNGLNDLADNDDLEAITRKINGGLNGLDDRRKWLIRVEESLTMG